MLTMARVKGSHDGKIAAKARQARAEEAARKKADVSRPRAEDAEACQLARSG
jgi:hypothetical protein